MHDHSMHEHPDEGTLKDYLLFAGVIIFIIISSLLIAPYFGGLNIFNYFRILMGVFFLIFGAFKLLDLPGFVMSYIGYDIIAKRFTAYAYAYPFIEIALAAGYFFSLPYIDFVTLILMTIGSIGVLRQLLRGSKIRCACLGTYIKLPLTTVSLVEDLAMGAMALILLVST